MRTFKLTTDEANVQVWHNILEEQKKQRTELIELEMEIRNAMIEYLKTVGETEDFNLIFESFGAVKLSCDGDLFDLEQIGGFCDVFNLEIVINNRLVVENYLNKSTDVKTNYLFQTKPATEEKEE